MRHTAAEKYETIRLVEGSDLPVRRTLRELQVNPVYVLYVVSPLHGARTGGAPPRPSAACRDWNRIPPRVRERVVEAALALSK